MFRKQSFKIILTLLIAFTSNGILQITAKYSTKIHPMVGPEVGESRAFLRFEADGLNRYFGAEGNVSTQNPQVGPNRSSWSLLWVEIGNKELIGNYSILQAGWGVSPEVFGDSKTHLIAYWSSYLNGESAGGCYNDNCRGFVHTNKQFPFNYALVNISQYEGAQYELKVTIQQDHATKNWFLKFQDVELGYWGSDIVPHLVNGADRISFGGITRKSPDGISPPMGYGKFPDDYLDHSSYIKNICSITEKGNRIDPIGSPHVIIDKPECYDLRAAKDTKIDKQVWLTYGGPGGVCFA